MSDILTALGNVFTIGNLAGLYFWNRCRYSDRSNAWTFCKHGNRPSVSPYICISGSWRNPDASWHLLWGNLRWIYFSNSAQNTGYSGIGGNDTGWIPDGYQVETARKSSWIIYFWFYLWWSFQCNLSDHLFSNACISGIEIFQTGILCTCGIWTQHHYQCFFGFYIKRTSGRIHWTVYCDHWN